MNSKTGSKMLMLLAAFSFPSGCSDSLKPNRVAVKIGGREIQCELIRSRAALKQFLDWNQLTGDNSYVVAYSEPRYQYYHSHGPSYDMLFTDASGKVLEWVELKGGDENGITSSHEATHAFVFAPGMREKLGVRPGDKIDLPEAFRKDFPPLLAKIKVRGKEVGAETAVTGHQTQHGLMFRKHMSKNNGMLFFQTKPSDEAFWMRNCKIDLDIAFFRADKSLINVVEMRKYKNPAQDSEPKAAPKEPAKYVLEMNYGWFRSQGLIRGDGSPAGKVYLEVPSDAGQS